MKPGSLRLNMVVLVFLLITWITTIVAIIYLIFFKDSAYWSECLFISTVIQAVGILIIMFTNKINIRKWLIYNLILFSIQLLEILMANNIINIKLYRGETGANIAYLKIVLVIMMYFFSIIFILKYISYFKLLKKKSPEFIRNKL